jgi:hypothetical protein
VCYWPLTVENSAMTTARFTPEQREHLLTLVEAEWSLARACAAVGISRQTVSAWIVRGRHDPASEAGAFAARYDAARAARANGSAGDHDGLPEGRQPGLPPDDPWRRVEQGDPFIAITEHYMAQLTPEQQARAIEVHEAAIREARRKAPRRSS